MKIKQDFVTNSSSTSFVISLPKSHPSRCLFKIVKLKRFETYRCMKSIRDLVSFVQNEKADWISDIRGPKYYHYFNKEKYEHYKKYLQDNPKKYLVYTSVDRNDYERMKNIEDFLKMIDGEILEKDYG